MIHNQRFHIDTLLFAVKLLLAFFHLLWSMPANLIMIIMGGWPSTVSPQTVTATGRMGDKILMAFAALIWTILFFNLFLSSSPLL